MDGESRSFVLRVIRVWVMATLRDIFSSGSVNLSTIKGWRQAVSFNKKLT